MTTVCRLHEEHDLRVEELEEQSLVPGCVEVAISRGGICGSDLHYYQHGGFGPVRVKEPIILGHEIAGTIHRIGHEACDLKVGDRVAVSPSKPCFECHFCLRAEYQHCINMQFMGSARTFPHVQGGFRSLLPVAPIQCFKVSNETSLSSAACAEPLAVCLHAASQAGDLKGKKILVTGAGPIGALCVAVAKARGADSIVVTDLFEFTLRNAVEMGATIAINVATSAHETDRFQSPQEQFDVVFECSAAEAAIAMAIACVRPRGTIVQVGVAGNVALPIHAIVGKEITFKGTHRFHEEFREAVSLIEKQEIDVEPIVTQVYPVRDCVRAFETALDRSSAIKVQLSFDA